MNKVQGGTIRSDQQSMCLNCRNALVAKGINNQQIISCISFRRDITFPVASCSGFDDKRHAPYFEMSNIAWVIKSRARGPMGFIGDGKTEVVIEPPDTKTESPTPQRGM